MPIPRESKPAGTVVYTCVTNGYDRVIPPADPVPGVDYILFTDRPEDRVTGWQVRPIAAVPDLPPALRNRYYKLLPHKVLPEYETSLYLDANIRITRSLGPLLDDVFGPDGADVTLFRHPLRDTVAAEMETCLTSGRVRDPEALRREYAAYRADGFPDTVQLTGNSILMRRHMRPAVIEAMTLWWDLVAAHSGRDQISLPYVRWKQGLDCRLITPHFSIQSPYFHRYPHWAACGLRGRAYVWSAVHRGRGPLPRLLHDLLARSYGARASH